MNNPTFCGIYIIRNNITGDFYGGSSINIHKRWLYHKNQAREGKTKTYKHGRSGTRNPASKLTLDQIEQIRTLFDVTKGKWKMYNELAPKFNVSWGTIRNVIEGNTYAS